MFVVIFVQFTEAVTEKWVIDHLKIVIIKMHSSYCTITQGKFKITLKHLS